MSPPRADGEEMSGVLRVNAAVRGDRQRRVAGAEGELQEDALLDRPSLGDGVEEAVLAVRVDGAAGVDGRRVHAPLEALGLRGDAGDDAVGLAAARLCRGGRRLP